MKQKDKDLIWASGTFLSTELPEDFPDWPEEKLFDFLEHNAWAPFDYWDGEELWAHIQDLAVSMRKYVEKN